MHSTLEAPNQPSYDFAQHLIDEGQYAHAAVQLEELLRKIPDHAAAHNDLGVLRFRSGDHTAALAHMLQALRLEPANISFAENIIDVCHSLGLHQQAGEMEELVGRQKNGSPASTNPLAEPSIDGPMHRVIGGIDFDRLQSQVVADKHTLLTWYWNYHPRLRFLKCLAPGVNVVDIGAGDGGLINWREWLTPARTDLHVYAVDLRKGQSFDKYEGFQICNLDEQQLAFDTSFFGAGILSHVLEHIAEPKNLMRELRRVMQIGGEMYIEVPTLASMDFPSRRVFLEAGVPVSTVNFFDDSTHRTSFSLNELGEIAEATGFRVKEHGVIRNRFAEETLMLQGAAQKDEELCTYGVWSRLGFAHFVIVEAV